MRSMFAFDLDDSDLLKLLLQLICNSWTCISWHLSINVLPQVMLDTVGPELQVVNKSETPISLVADGLVTLTPHLDQEATDELLPINFDGLAKV